MGRTERVYAQCDRVERAGVALVQPLLLSWASPKVVIDTNTFVRSVDMQRTVGDYIIPRKDGRGTSCVEVKTERRYTGNLFAETWSNRPDPDSEAERWARDGWLMTLQSDMLVSVYLDVSVALVVPLPRLREWCLSEGHLYRYPEKVPDRFAQGEQRNRTVGHPIPYADLAEPVGVKPYLLVEGRFKNVDLADIVPLPRLY